MKYLIDTDWIIHALHGKRGVARKLLELREEGLAVSVISLAELYEGVYRSADPVANEKVLKDFLSGVMVLGLNDEICKMFGELRAKLRKQGNLMGDFDLLIASTCLCHNLTLLTDNIKDFERVENLNFLSSQRHLNFD
jgi:tRNA(fMet)-specific endonuclease VapC